jgi:TonB-dependent starch-binding outer membrane protein SusC
MKKIDIVQRTDIFNICSKQTLRIMKLTSFLLLFTVLNVFGTKSYSQNTRLTLNMKDTPIQNVLNTIEERSEYFFLFSSKMIDVNQKVNIEVSDKKINEVLDLLFTGTEIKYLLKDRQILLVDKNDETTSILQQQKSVSGTILDATTGEAMPGVNILVKGGTIGAISDMNGKFTINIPDENAVLTISFIGYNSVEIPLAGRKILDIKLEQNLTNLEEVVIVGFGTQKKVNLTGSVTAVASKDIEKLSVTQTSQLLTGLVSGVTATQSSGQPGKDNVNITIRGLGTFSGAGTGPLVLVDGLASSLDNVNINDIASISVLKDAASAAIYGTRGANGVILIETKKGKSGGFKVSYQANFGIQKAAEIPQIVDSWVYAEMYNEALTNAGGSPQYSADEIAKFKSGADPDNYPNKKHFDDLISSGSGLQTDHHLSMSGGSEKNTFMFSLGYLNQAGLIAETNYTRYNAMLNVESKLKDNLVLKVKFSGQNGNSNEPTAVDKNPALGVEGLLNYAIKIPNTYAGKMSNGYYGNQTGFTIEGWMDSQSFISNKNLDATTSASLDWNITKSLKLTGLAGYNFGSYRYKFFRPVLVVDQFITQGPSELTIRNTTNALLTAQAFLNYDLSIKDNSFHVLLGYSQESNRNDWIQAFRDNFPNNLIYEIDGGAASNQQNNGSASEWALRSFFGRINYDYLGKYLLEVNARYDGSSRFPANKRYGLFPSLSAGWRVSKENFFKVSWIDDLKLRASWGKLGNQNIGNYPYQQVLTLGMNAPFGTTEKLSSGAAATIVPNVNITWESTRVTDFGFDLSIFRSKLNFSVDYYDKLTSGILYNITASRILGLTPSVQNAGVVSNKGIDFNIQHQNTIGDFSYSIAANFSYDKNEVKELANVTRDINNGLFIGYSLQSIYGYVADGLFVDQADVTNSPTQPRIALPGDIKLVDISGPDGVPDGKVDADYDRKIIGNTFPKYNFGANLNARYKGFDLNVQLQGVAGLDKIISGHEGNAFMQGSSPQQWMVDSRWTKDNPSATAAYPRFLVLGGGEQQFWNSTFIMQDAAYLRVNNIQIGYSLPATLAQKLKLSDLRFYVGIKNLLTFDHFREGWDPEMTTGYPPVRYFNVGLNTNF